MTTERTGRAGSRQALPTDDKACASCAEPRGKRRTGWTRITTTDPEGGERVAGWTCPACPTWTEPIRREVSDAGRVRYLARVDATEPGAAKRRQAAKRCGSLAEARAFVADVRAQVARAGAYNATEAETLDGLCTRWLSTRHDVRAVTVDGYRSALIPVLRHMGDRPVAKITRSDIEALVAKLATDGGKRGQALSPRTVRAALIALGQAFALAERDGLVSVNPVHGVKPPRSRRAVGTDIEHWHPDELLRFRTTADTDALAGAWRLTLCGLTRADVMGLRWSDVDLDRGRVTIRQGRVMLMRGDAVDEPKSAQRRRTVPVEQIHPGTVALLRKMHAQQAKGRLAAGAAWIDSGLVVVDALGVPLRPELYSDRFRKLSKTAEVPTIRLHSVRHSLAFWLHSLGVTPAAAAALLGHTVDVHLSTYLPEAGADGIAAAAAALAGVTGPALRAV